MNNYNRQTIPYPAPDSQHVIDDYSRRNSHSPFFPSHGINRDSSGDIHDPYVMNVAAETFLEDSIHMSARNSHASDHLHSQFHLGDEVADSNDSVHNHHLDDFDQNSGEFCRDSSDSSAYEDQQLAPQKSQENDDKRVYTRNSRMFMAVSVISGLLVLALEVYMFAVINIHKNNYQQFRYVEISIFLALFIFAAIYQIILTFIGLRTKNMLLLTMLCIFEACMLIYTGIQYQEVTDKIELFLDGGWRRATRASSIATICVIAVTLVVQVYLVFFVLRKNVYWFRFKKIGGDLKIRRMYSVFQIHRSLLIFDLFFFIGFTIQFIVIMVKRRNSVEFILTICVLPVALVVLLLSDIAVTREVLALSILTTTCFFGACAYVLFKMIRLYTKYTSAYNINIKNPGDYFPGRKSLITFGALTLVLLVSTIVIEIWVMRNYKRGLLPSVSVYYSWLPGHNKGRKDSSHEHMTTDMDEVSGKKIGADEDSGSLMID
ncbi:hypothetical protein G9P44_001710 [Scheffersomyces stipitis]|nr:hypothetical protein G9P44_001710 [Scheffersomyces stipitis]